MIPRLKHIKKNQINIHFFVDFLNLTNTEAIDDKMGRNTIKTLINEEVFSMDKGFRDRNY